MSKKFGHSFHPYYTLIGVSVILGRFSPSSIFKVKDATPVSFPPTLRKMLQSNSKDLVIIARDAREGIGE